jgi:hypothetical protein
VPIYCHLPRLRVIVAGFGAALLAAVAATVPAGAVAANADTTAIKITSSSVRGGDGQRYTVTNHLTRDALRRGQSREWLLVWAGDAGADEAGSAAPAASSHATHTSAATTDPDFLAVVDATPTSPSYGQVVNTATLDPQHGNEPHHMQYTWNQGDRLYAGGILSDTTFVFDISKLPEIRFAGINLPADTPCGSVPDAYAVLSDGTAYGTYMGGPDVSGPCTYTDGEVRVGNGYAGSPGELVRLGRDGRTLSETPAMQKGGESTQQCPDRPALPEATCANPHGLAVREDLNRMVVSDFAEIRNYLDLTNGEFDPYLIRNTVRIFDISNRNRPKLVNVTHMPTGPRVEQYPVFEEEKLFMEAAVTHEKQHRGAFASTMWGGAVYYAPDITAKHPAWREIFDDTTAYGAFDTTKTLTGAGDGGSWLQVSPDDKYLYHTVMGVQLGGDPSVTSGMLYTLDIHKLIAAGNNPACRIDELSEITTGGHEPDCPALVSVVPVHDGTNGGPHWAAMDTFVKGADGKYRDSSQVTRIAMADYFLARLGGDGDHRVCMVNVARNGKLALDRRFGGTTGNGCIAFNRATWPHGNTGDARPHGVLFVVADSDLRGPRRQP